MGSLKKKFAKTLRKITPKEIAPILPFLAMAIPGMQGLTPLLKFALPQLLTAAGSARQTGKISLMNQAMAGIGSLASINAANAAAVNTAGTGLQAGDAYAAANASGAMGSLPGSVPVLPGGTNLGPAAYANANVNPNLYSNPLNVSGGSTVNNALNKAAQLVGNNKFVLPMGEAMNNPGINLPYAMAVGGTGASMATADYAGKKELEFEEDKARDIATIGNYRDARSNLTDYFTDQDYTLEDLYGVGNVPDFLRENFLAANGGRAKLAGGGYQTGNNASANTSSNKDKDKDKDKNSGGNAGGYNPHTPSGTSLGQQFAGQSMPGPGNMPNGGGGGNENIVYGPAVNPAVAFIDPLADPKFDKFKNFDDDDESDLGNYLDGLGTFDFLGGEFDVDIDPGKKEIGLSFTKTYADGGRIGFNEGGGTNNNPDGPPGERIKMRGNYDPSTMKPENQVQAAAYDVYMNSLPPHLQQSGMGGNFPLVPRPTTANQSAFNYNNVATNNNNDVSDAIKNMLAYNQYAYGGRIGLANGGMEGIMGAMQAPGVPAGMELDYRSSGGFIPMGGPERADDVPAMLSKNEFVMTADAVRGLGNGDIESGAQQMYDLMNNLEAQG